MYEKGLLQPIKDVAPGADGVSEAERDDVYWRAVELVISQKQASISFVQRRLGLGYPKAARFREGGCQAARETRADPPGG